MLKEYNKTANVLIIDDTQINLNILDDTLNDISGINIITAISGERGIEILNKFDVAVILLDISMPGIDGLKTAEFIRDNDAISHIPIMFMTAYGDMHIMKGYELGAVDYITKPFNLQVIRSKVQVFVDLHKLKEMNRIQELRQLEYQKKHELAVKTAALNKELNLSNQRLRDLSNRYLELQEDERKRLAREVHDELGQQLAVAKMRLSIPGQVFDKDELIKMLDQLILVTRQLSKSLRPAQLDHLGIVAAISEQIKTMTDDTNINYEFNTNLDEKKLGNSVESTLFRVIQEGLHNIQKYSMATCVIINLHENGGEIELEMKDNGIGLKAPDLKKKNSFGLLGIKERIHSLSGTFDIISDKGTHLKIRIPI